MKSKAQQQVKLSEEKLQSWNMLSEFRKILQENSSSPPCRKGGPKRLLTEDDYLCSFLFAQFNLIISSMRGLCACSQFQKVQQKVCSRPMSLRSFLEAQSVFHALPRMSWTHWRNFSKANSTIRLHLKFRLLDKKPSAVVISKAKLCERKALETMIEPGEFYVGDRYYGRDYQFLKRVMEALRFHQLGMVSEDELAMLIHKSATKKSK